MVLCHLGAVRTNGRGPDTSETDLAARSAEAASAPGSTGGSSGKIKVAKTMTALKGRCHREVGGDCQWALQALTVALDPRC